VDLPFWGESDAFSLNQSIVRVGKPNPLFASAVLRITDVALRVRTML
jgi:hypothetical protein